MPKNIVKEFSTVESLWTAPAGVTSIKFTILDKSNFKIAQTGANLYSLSSTGAISSCGTGTLGQLGDSTVISKSIMVPVSGSHSFIKLSAQANCCLALKSDGSVWSWGSNTNGRLGDGTLVNKSSPVPVIGGHSFIDISSGNSSQMALKSDGTVWTWGSNTSGQLGDGTIVSKSSPVQVIGGHSFVEISLFGGTPCALKSDGTLWSWGLNSNGQIGDGTVSSKSSPVAVIGGHSFIKLASRGYWTYSIALKADGSAWTWGQNNLGQLGDGTIIDKSSPVAVIGGHSFIQVGAGGSNSTAGGLKEDGTAWTWGAGTSGQLGDGTLVSKSSPVAVSGGFLFSNLDIADSTTSATISSSLNNGLIYSWGSNGGNFANGTTGIGSSTPIASTSGASTLIPGSPIIVNQKILTVVPGQTYRLNTFLSSFVPQAIRNKNNGNNLTIVIEYNI